METTRPYIWLSSKVVPPSGSDLAAFIINPTTEELHYGVLGAFARWSGSTWASAGTWTSSLSSWGGFGEVGRPSNNMVVPAIGFSTPALGIGGGHYFRVPELAPGRYRIGHGPAYGVFEVSRRAPTPISLDDQRDEVALMIARPSLLTPAGGQVRLVTIPRTHGVQTARQVRLFNAEIEPIVHFERRSDAGWAVLETLIPRMPDGRRDHSDEVMIHLPSVPPGPYRLVRRHRSGHPTTRVIWVADDLPTGLRLDQLGLAVRPHPIPPPRAAVYPTGTPPSDQESARAAIAAAFSNFWTLSPDDRSVPTVEGGEHLGPTLSAYLLRRKSVSEHADVALSVDEIEFIDATRAAVWFTISINGTPMIHNHRGDAVANAGSWMMSRSTFCELMTRAGVACPPEVDRI